MSVGIERETYKVLSKFECNGIKMVVVKMKNATCVMDLDEYKYLMRLERDNQ